MADPDDGKDDLSADQIEATTRRMPPGADSVVDDRRLGGQGESSQDRLDPLLGLIIADRYQIEGLLGEGGMASVYAARHIVLNKRVAIKLLHRSKAMDNETITRFQQEASGLSLLQHPNLVSISDFGLADTGHPYCVMDLVEGKPLSDLIHEGSLLELKRLSQLFSDVCGALEYAHKKNTIHRDLKPSNIIIAIQDDGKWTPKLIDFGIAKFGDLHNQVLTRTGVVFGSPYYMSPEQCEGNKLDPRSDIYSLGCTMYEAITGRPPFIGQSAMQTLAMHASKEPPALHSVRKDVPVELEKIVLKCLAKRPEDRYQSALELQRDIDNLDLDTANRHARYKWLGKAIAATVLIGIASALLVQLDRANSNDEEKIAHIEDAGLVRSRIDSNKRNPAFSQRTLAALYCRLIQLDGDNGRDSLKDVLEAYKQLVEPDLKDVSYYTWHIANACGWVRFREHDFYQAALCEQASLNIYDKAPADPRMLTTESLECINIILEGCINENPVDQKKIHAKIDQAFKIWKKIQETVDKERLSQSYPVYGDLFLELAARCGQGGDLTDSITCCREAVTIYGKIPDDTKRSSAEVMCTKMLARLHASKPPNAGSGPSAIEMPESIMPEIDENIRREIDAASKKANAASSAGEKLEYSRHYYELCHQYLPDSAEAFHSTCFLSYANKNADHREEACALAREALSMSKRLGLAPTRDTFDTIPILLQTCIARYDKAGTTRYEKLYFEVSQSLYPNNPSRLAKAEMDVGYILSLEDQEAEALHHYWKARQLLEGNKLTSSEDYSKTIDMLKLLQKKVPKPGH